MEPLVCAIMLTRDRPEMAARAVRAFREQTYPNKRLMIWETSEKVMPLGRWFDDSIPGTMIVRGKSSEPIGSLRNQTCAEAFDEDPETQILIHWDDDDVSHPNRIAEQVAFLQASGADVVGYDEMLFWRTDPGEAWLYSHYRVPNRHAPGTSFCYWRKTWEKKQFNPQLPRNGNATGEDYDWLNGSGWNPKLATTSAFSDGGPRMIASIHGGNTMDYSKLTGPCWDRVPEWDAHCRERMAL